MSQLPVIDADSHVEECEATWSHLEPRFRDRRPIHLNLAGTPGTAAKRQLLAHRRPHPCPPGHARQHPERQSGLVDAGP